MSKFKKETNKTVERFIRMNFLKGEYAGRNNSNNYKRNFGPGEFLCVLMGDDLLEECDWGPDLDRILNQSMESNNLLTYNYENCIRHLKDITLPHINQNFKYNTFFIRTFFYWNGKNI